MRRWHGEGGLRSPGTVPSMLRRFDWQGGRLSTTPSHATSHEAHQGIVHHQGARYTTRGRVCGGRRSHRHFIAIHWNAHRLLHAALRALLHGRLVLLSLPRATHQEHAAMAQREAVHFYHQLYDHFALWFELFDEFKFERSRSTAPDETIVECGPRDSADGLERVVGNGKGASFRGRERREIKPSVLNWKLIISCV